MKLVRLRVKGLRSFRREADIDLARLGEEGLFAIFGPTGAGKSTILDGIFLALFAKCPRGEPADCVSMGEKELEVRLEVAIDEGRGPTAVAIDRKFRWSRPPSEGADARKSSRHAPLRLETLERGTWKPLDLRGKKPEEVLRDRIVKVGASDFQQAVVLPQGEFDALLKAAPSERRRLVSSLFRTEHLGEPLHALVRAREEAVRIEIAKIEHAALEVHATAEEVEEASRAAEVARAEADSKAGAAAAGEARAARLRVAYEACAARDRARCEHESARTKLADRARDRDRVAEALRASSTGPTIDELDRAEDALASAELAAKAARTAAREAREKLANAVHASLSAKREREDKEPNLRERLERAKLAVAAASELPALEVDAREKRDRATAAERRAKARAAERDEAERARERAAREEANLAKELEATRVGERERAAASYAVALAELSAAEAALRSARASAVGEADDAATALEGELLRAEDHERAAAAIAEAARAEVARCEVDLRRATDLVARAERAMEAARDEAAAAAIAAKLRDGEACPVCGAREHPGASHAMAELQIAIAERSLADARRSKDAADRAREAAVLERAAREEDARIAGALLEDLSKRAADARARAERVARGEEIVDSVAAAEREAARLADVAVLRAEGIEEAARVAIRSKATADALDALRGEEVALGKRARAAEAIAHAAHEARARAAAMGAAASVATAAVTEAEAARALALEDLARAEASLSAKRAEVAALVESLAPFGKTRSRRGASEQLELVREKTEIAAPEIWIQRIEGAMAALFSAERAAQAAVDRARGEESRASLAAREADARVSEASMSAARARTLALAAVASNGFASIDAARSARMDPSELTRLAAEMSALEADCETKRIVLAAREADVTELVSEGDALGAERERDTARESAAAARDAAISAVARREDLRAKHARHLELRARIDELSPRADRLAKIREVVKANQLSELAAERHLEAVTSRAASLLQQLSKDRYGLVRTATGAFAVADAAHGGVVRPPSTLSGGETFLVSLALALALSERIQLAGRTRFDFFFLDEGFGSLDAATLEIAIGALEALRGPNRIIGMISHVGALEERMPRRLRVAPARGGSATVVVEA